MGKLKCSPAAVFKSRINGGSVCATGFGKNSGYAVIKIFQGIRCMAKMKLPVFIHIDFFANARLRGTKRRCKNKNGEEPEKWRGEFPHKNNLKKNNQGGFLHDHERILFRTIICQKNHTKQQSVFHYCQRHPVYNPASCSSRAPSKTHPVLFRQAKNLSC